MKLRYALAALGAAAVATLGVAAPSAGASTTGTQHFVITTTDPAEDAVQFIAATGPIHALGSVEHVSPSIDRFVFPAGSLRVHHSFTRGSGSNDYDPVTCLGVITEDGIYQVVRGTGAYKGASGSGTYHLSVTFVGCNEENPPRLFFLRIDASGPLTLPSAA